MNPFFVVITVPHAIRGFGWDESSLNAAKTLFRVIELRSEKLTPVMFVPLIDRGQCDLNRYNECSMNSDYLRRIKKFISENEKNVLFVLDIHSFDGRQGHFRIRGVTPEIALLDDGVGSTQLTHDLGKYLNETGVSSNVFQGKRNLLHSTLRTPKIETSLIEFNDELSQERTEYICEKITEVLDLHSTSF